MKLVSIGEITIDHYLRQDRYFVGGISLNFAVNAKRCGCDQVSLVSCLGDGPDAAIVLDLLALEGVDSSHVALLAGQSATCAIDVDEDANRHFPAGGYQPNVLEQLHLSAEISTFVQQHDIHVAMYDGDHSTSLLGQLLALPRKNTKRVVDFGDWSAGRRKVVDTEIFNQIDLAFISGDEATLADLVPVAAEVNALLVVTLGAAGSAAITTDGVLRQVALPAAKVDSTGCGDAFQAAFTVKYFAKGNMAEGDIAEALYAGASQAATVLQHYGAFEQSTF